MKVKIIEGNNPRELELNINEFIEKQSIKVSDIKYQKGEWYHVQEDGTLKPVDYEKEVKEYYKKWSDNYGN